MQGLLDPPRTGLTATQVMDLVSGSPGVTYQRGLEVLDASLNVLADISTSFQGGKVSRTNLATIHGTCSLTISVDINFETQLLRPYVMIVADDGTSARFNCGVYFAHKPSTQYGTTPLSNAVSGFDRLYLLKRPVGDAYTVTAGTGYLAAVAQAITDAGLGSSTILLDGTASAKTLPADRTWPMVATPQSPTTATTSGPTTWLRVVNDLLSAVGYRGIWADWNGLFRSEPYMLPATRASEWTFNFDDPLLSTVGNNRTIANDLSNVPNVWVFLRQNLTNTTGDPIEPTEGAGQYTVTNQSTGPTSIDRRGLEWVSVVQLDAVDQATLAALGNARVAADQAVAVTYSVTTAPLPLAWHFDVYTYIDNRAGGATVQSLGWTLDLGTDATPPADMSHKWQKVGQ